MRCLISLALRARSDIVLSTSAADRDSAAIFANDTVSAVREHYDPPLVS